MYAALSAALAYPAKGLAGGIQYNRTIDAKRANMLMTSLLLRVKWYLLYWFLFYIEQKPKTY